MNDTYFIGQTFEGIYPPEASVWCNQNNAYIDLIQNNPKIYQIKEVPPYVPTIAEEVAELKANLANSDYAIVKIAEAETDEERQALRERYATLITQRKEWRQRINELENE